jgi:hypothetical protein
MIAMMKTGAKLEAIASNAMNMERTKTKLQMIRSYKESFGYLRILSTKILVVIVKISMHIPKTIQAKGSPQFWSKHIYLKLWAYARRYAKVRRLVQLSISKVNGCRHNFVLSFIASIWAILTIAKNIINNMTLYLNQYLS